MVLIFQVLVGSAVGGAGVAAIVLWLTRLWLSERIKAAIKNEYDEKLETHKAQLKAQSLEHEIRFSRLHEMRVERIAETYSCLKEMYTRLSDYTKPFEPAGGSTQQERFERLVRSYRSFVEAYAKNLIFFPNRTANKLEDIDRQCSQAGTEFRDHVELQDSENRTRIWAKIHKTVSTEIDATLKELEAEFRRLLGEES